MIIINEDALIKAISAVAIKQEIEVRTAEIAQAKKSIENLKKSIAAMEAQILTAADETRELKADLRLLTEETAGEDANRA